MNPVLKKSVSLYTIMLSCILVMALALSVIYFISEQTVFGMIVVLTMVLISLLTALGIMAFRRTLRDKIINDSVKMANSEMQYMRSWNNPYAIFKEDGRLVWMNDTFEALFQKQLEAEDDPRLQDLIGLYKLPGRDENTCTEVELLEKTWKMVLEQEVLLDAQFQSISEILYAISLEDITHERELEIENFNIKPVVCLIYIDNYEQTMSSTEDTQRPMLEAMVYRRLNDLTVELKGVLNRLEKDRLSLVFPNETLGILKENKFSVLEDIRQINNGNSLPVTLSMGIGAGETLARSYSMAQTAVDLALGRGGDQAVVKDTEKTVFFGGKSSGVEKTTRVRARLIAGNMKELINDAQTVLVMGHAKPDMDCYGAAWGIISAVTDLGKTAYLVLGSSLNAVERLHDRFMEDKDYSDKIISPAKAEELSGPKTLVIVVDVSRPSIVEAPELLEKNENIIVIDHHRLSVDSVSEALISYIEPYSSSASEMVTELIQYIADHKVINPLIADALFSGITLDTKNFVSKAGIRTFDAAAYLRRCGADAQRVRQLFKNEMGEYKNRIRIISTAEVIDNRFALSWWDGRHVENAQTLSAAASDDLLDIAGIEASFVATQLEDYIAISARSSGEVNVQVIMEKMGGGGHLSMAGAQLHCSLDEAVEETRKAIAEYIAE